MDYDKVKALTEASREKSAAQREPEPKEFPSRILGQIGISRLRSKRTDGTLGEAAVMITPTIFQWYRILRQHYRFTVFQAVRGALWLAS